MSAIEDFVRDASPDEAALVRKLDALIREAMPGLVASLKWGNLTYHHARNVCAIVRHRQHVNLQLWSAAGLSDPDHLLAGTGKAMRHIKFRVGEPFAESAVRKIFITLLQCSDMELDSPDEGADNPRPC